MAHSGGGYKVKMWSLEVRTWSDIDSEVTPRTPTKVTMAGAVQPSVGSGSELFGTQH